MVDNRFKPGPVAGWFVIGAIASLLFMLLGCAGLYLHLTADPAALPLDQRALFNAEPAWVLAASGVGFIVGSLGAIMLLMRRRIAEPLLLVALLGFAVWLVGMFMTADFRDLLCRNDMAVMAIDGLIAWTIYWFARHSRRRGWLS
jgi:hypothetical protein